MFEDKYYVYAMDKEGRHDKPYVTNNLENADKKAALFIEVFPEVMICDADDFCIFHWKDGELLFPKY